MHRLALICLLCFTCRAGESLQVSVPVAPWVSCYEDPPSTVWKGPKTVRTPPIMSSDGGMKAYAQIEARKGGPMGCENTVRLFVSTGDSAGFRQVFIQKDSPLNGNANSMLPIGWSPDGRWLLVQFAIENYASDFGGIDVLVYDRGKNRTIRPDVNYMIKTALKQDCWINIGSQMSFDASSRIHLRLADFIDEGDDEPQTHCFHGEEEWVLDLKKGTMHPIIAER